MKKLSALIITLFILFIPALADNSIYDGMSDIECLAKGIIRTENHTLDSFLKALYIVDESENYLDTDKFEFFVSAIEGIYYTPITKEELFDRFRENNPYVDTRDMDKVFIALFDCLDKYSYYLPSETSDSFWSPMDQRGIGISLVYDQTGEAYGSVGTFVEGVSRYSSAWEAGIKTGDRLISYMGLDVSRLPFEAISAMLSATAEQNPDSIDITIERYPNTVLSYTLERRETTFNEYSFHLYPEKDAFMLSLKKFSNYATPDEILARMKELKAQGYKHAILDLRGNSGGDVNVALGVISAFVEGEKLAFTMGREGIIDYYSYHTYGGGVKFKSLYVLVDSYSASSSEITALCLKQHAGAIIVGEKTIGKAVAQSAGRIIDGSTFGITTYVAYDAYKQTYNEKGITPRFMISCEVVPYEFPKDLEWFNYINYVEAKEGAQNDVVTALERRLEIMGFLKSDKVDGKWDKETTNAVKALQFTLFLEPTGTLSPELVELITDIINSYKTSEVLLDHQLNAVLQMII